MKRKYYVVLSRYDGGQWAIEFGDNERETAQSELDDMKYSDKRLPKAERRSLKLITVTGRTKKDVDAAVAAFNDRFFKDAA